MTGSFKLPVITFGDALSQAWLAARGLDASVNKEERMDLPSLSCSNRWLFYRPPPPRGHIRTAYHGTWWYALWGLLRSGRVLESLGCGLTTADQLAAGRWSPGGHPLPTLLVA